MLRRTPTLNRVEKLNFAKTDRPEPDRALELDFEYRIFVG